MRIVPNFKVLGLAGAMALTSGMVSSCQNHKTEQKPMYNVTLTQPCDKWFAKGNQKTFPVKMEEGCSYESENKIYIVCNGQLYSINKKTQTMQETDTISISDYEAEVFKNVACYNTSVGDTMELSAENIEKYFSKQNQETLTIPENSVWRPSVMTKKIENGFEARIRSIPYYTNVFKYNVEFKP